MVLLEAPVQRRIDALRAAPWFRAAPFLARCCPRLDLAAYAERCMELATEDEQLVRFRTT